MADVASMLRWSLPPILVYIVLLVKFAGMTMSPLDFVEIFSGKGELSRAMRSANFIGVSIDYDHDPRTQDLLS
ncbi:unnamed protein product, partial [Durusdinium trenchii]